MERPNAWKKYDEAALAELEDLCGKYRAFISENNTERECMTASIELGGERRVGAHAVVLAMA